MAHIKTHFCELPPLALVEFTAPQGVRVGQEIDVQIMPAQHCRVRIIHEDEQSLTLATLVRHPEAGRITFGAYRNGASELVFHIRSRARSSGTLMRIGFIVVEEAMQTDTWTDFINRAAESVGAQVRDATHADTERVEALAEDDAPLTAPTFTATGN